MSKSLQDTNRFDVIVVGGGASGLLAAGRAAERGLRVLILEKNRTLGEKLKITGGGRCNITNAELDERKLLKFYGDAEQFLYSTFKQFSVKETFSFFESRGLSLVVEANKRAFPETHKAGDVLKVLSKYIEEGKVTVLTNSPVTKIESEGEKISALLCGKERFEAEDFIFATGGYSHPETGSTGDGFKWLKDLGHTVVPPTPSIVPISTKETWSKKLAGIAIDEIKITFFVEGKKAFTKKGRILFTHFGLSGPLILNSAYKISDLLHTGEVTAKIDLYPTLDLGQLDEKLIKAFDNNKNKDFKNAITEIVPVGTARGILEILGEFMDTTKKTNSVSREERKQVGQALKSLPLTVTGLMGFERAVVADGGLLLEEVDMRTMRSKKVSNLLVTGDLLHIKRPTGGYSLQLCWTTGFVAGSHAGKNN